ncbi:hypothetical protein [Cereibacter changlensis]|nr:hypothetical protein [Cereibacter changlensis]
MDDWLKPPPGRKPSRTVLLCLILGCTGLLLLTDSASRGLSLLLGLLP